LTVPEVDSWYHEKESAGLYRRVAGAEPDPTKRELFLKLSAAAEQQADKWQARHPGAAPRTHLPAIHTLAARTSLDQVGARRRSALRGALRMVLIGGAAGTVSFLLGRALGAVVG
jgi:ferric-dicitrate binding protein FerR (iron transport regulator)